MAVPAGWPSLRPAKAGSVAPPAARRGGWESACPLRRSPGEEVGSAEGQEELQGFGRAPACAALFSHTEMLGD